MQIFTKLLKSTRGKPGRAAGLNLWRQWLANPRALRWLLCDEDVLRPGEVESIEGWAERQLEWGLHTRTHAGPSGLPQVVEVFGPDLIEPHVLLYRIGDEIQVDESHGESRRFADLAAALVFVTNYT